MLIFGLADRTATGISVRTLSGAVETLRGAYRNELIDVEFAREEGDR